MVAKNKRMSSFPLPGQSLNVMAQIEARKQMQHQRSSSSSSTVHHRNNNNNNTLIHMATSNDDSFTSLIANNNNNNTRRQQQQTTTTTDFTTFSTTELKSSISSDNEFDIDHQIIMTDSSTSTFTGLLNSFNAAADAAAAVEEDEDDDGNGVEDDKDVQFAMNYFAQEMVVVRDDHHHATTVKNNTPSPPIIATTATAEGEIMKQYTTEDGEEIVSQSMIGVQPTSLSRRNDVNNDDDHRDDDIYDTEDEYTASESANEDEEEDDDDYPTEAEEETTIGEFTEGEEDDDDESSVGSVGSVGSYNTLLEQMENDDTTIREVVIDATSMDKETAEDMAQQLRKCTSISTIRLSCRRLEHKEGRTRKHHVLTTLLSGITENTSIESIEIEDTDISHPLAHSLSQMCARKQCLKNIAMIQCQFIGSGLAILFLGMQHSQSIRNVIFQSCDLGNTHNNGGGGSTTAQQPSSYNVEIIASALPLMNLTSLSLVDVNFPTEECLHYLIENIEYAKELKLLDLSQNKLDVRSVVQLSKSMNRQNQISRLLLSSCSLDNVCMKELAVGLRGYDPLTNLDISRNRHVGDRTAVLVKDLLKGNSKITKLNVKGCSFSEVSLDALEAALRYNNSFLKTFVSVSTGQQIFDVVDALANLGVGGGEDEEDEEEWRVSDGGGGGSRKHHGGDDRRRHHARDVVGKQQFRTTPKKSNKSSSTSPMAVDRDRGDFVGNSIPPRRDEMLSLFNTSVDKRNGNVLSTPQQRDAKGHPSLHGQKVPRSPPPPPPPPPQVPRQDIPQGTQDSTSARRNVNVPMAQFFEDQVSIDRMSSSHSVQSGTKFASPQRTNGNVPTPQFTSTNEFFPSGSGQEPPGLQYSPRKSSKSPVSTPQYELRTTSSSQSGTSKPTRQGIISAKYGSQRKSAGQKSPKIDKVIAQLSPSKRDTVRSPRSPRSPGGSLSGRRVMV
eukprot:scaffold2120_cov137-Skeletonema_menzelii.AAC.2